MVRQIISFNRFLVAKKELNYIKHRKIVQKIFSEYIADKKELKLDCSFLRPKD